MKRFIKEIGIFLLSAVSAVIFGLFLAVIITPRNAGLAAFVYTQIGVYSMPVVFIVLYLFLRKIMFSEDHNKKQAAISLLVIANLLLGLFIFLLAR